MQPFSRVAGSNGIQHDQSCIDLCLKSMLHAYDGWGYEQILVHVVPMLRSHGVSQQSIDTIVIDNPRRLLDVP